MGCGNKGDSKFDHNWEDGVQACKITCCSAGGSWEGQCGKKDDSNFDHTWGEGIDACKASASVEAQTLVMPLKMEARPVFEEKTGSDNSYTHVKEVHDSNSAQKLCGKSLIFIVTIL